MLKYVLCAALAASAFGVAIHSHRSDGSDGPDGCCGKGDASAPVILGGDPPQVSAVEVDGERHVTVRHLVTGSVSRASLVYDLPDGGAHVAASQTDCQRSLTPAGPGETYSTPVVLSGPVPSAALAIRLVIESEIGKRLYPLAVDVSAPH